MKKLYLTYIQNGTVKKAVISEESLTRFQGDNSISNLIKHPNETIMERNYETLLCKDGSCKPKGRLFG